MPARFLLAFWPLLALACPSGKGPPADSATADDTGVNGGTTVEALCDAVFTLCDDHWGWEDTATCYTNWLGEGETWACVAPGRYLACAEPCPSAADCETFGACETSCWDQHCVDG